MEATTGLVGKSVYLELEFEEGNDYGFLGDWFGEKEREANLQTFLQFGAEDKAIMETAAFVHLPGFPANTNNPENLKLKIKVLIQSGVHRMDLHFLNLENEV